MTGFQLFLQGQEKQLSSFFKLNACTAVVKNNNKTTTPQQPKRLITFYEILSFLQRTVTAWNTCVDKVIYTEVGIYRQKAVNFWMKRSITSNREKTPRKLLDCDGYIAGTRESSIRSSGVDSDTTVWGAGKLCSVLQ